MSNRCRLECERGSRLIDPRVDISRPRREEVPLLRELKPPLKTLEVRCETRVLHRVRGDVGRRCMHGGYVLIPPRRLNWFVLGSLLEQLHGPASQQSYQNMTCRREQATARARRFRSSVRYFQWPLGGSASSGDNYGPFLCRFFPFAADP